MNCEIKTIILGGSSGNCYLIKSHIGFVLIDTGGKSKRKKLEKELEKAGCNSENFHLIILTHGDYDHSGNCAYLKEKYGVKVAMHIRDERMMRYGRAIKYKRKSKSFIKYLFLLFIKINQFKPDFNIDEGFSLSSYGLNARVIHLPGHSRGSIGVLTDDGDLFCGDLFTNIKKPEINKIMENELDARTSINKLKNYLIDKIYPGHGRPFPLNYLS